MAKSVQKQPMVFLILHLIPIVGNMDFHPKLKNELKLSYADVARTNVENQMRNTECKVTG